MRVWRRRSCALKGRGLCAQLRHGAATTLGYLSLQSRPVRVSNCARPPETRADMRKPSSLISWSHCGPDGATSTGWHSCGGIQRGSGAGASFRPRGALDLVACVAERFTTGDITANSSERTYW
jgi:hypothetical protein